MKTKTLFILVLSHFIISTALYGQNEKKSIAVKASKIEVATPSKAITKEARNAEKVRSQLTQRWSFYQITLRTPKVGHLMNISDKETDMMNFLITNYIFSEDGDIDLDPHFMEKQGVKSASWEMKDTETLVIKYYWTAEKQKAGKLANSEKLVFEINVISDRELSLNMKDMFIVNFVSERK